MRLGMGRRHRRSIIILPMLLSVLLYGTHHILKRAEPSFLAQASNYSNTAFTDLVNKCILEVFDKNDYKELYRIISDSKERVTALETDTAAINRLTSNLMINIQNTMNADYPAEISIPIGSLTKYAMLSSWGPDIKLKITPISIVNSEFSDSFESVGINQVKHTLYINITVDMLYSGYALHETERIKASVPVAESVIVGEVPQYYGAEAIINE